MLASLRRIYFYAVAITALLFLVGVLQNFVFQLSARAGVRLYLYETADSASFSRSVAFLVVALVIVLPVGVLHWWFIRRDAREDVAANGGVVRIIFLDLLTVLVGSVAVFAASNLAYALLYDPSANYSTASYYGYTPSIAAPLSLTVAWGAALVLIVLERRATTPLTGVAQGISVTLGYLQQAILLISVMVVGGRAVQAILDATIQAAPACTIDSYGVQFNAGCQPPPSTAPGGDVAQTLVLLAGLIGFTLWTQRDGGSVLRQLADSLFLIIATITAIIGLNSGVSLLLHLAPGRGASLPLSLVTNNETATFSFLGPLLFGGGALAFYLTRAWRTPAQGAHPQQTRQVALVAVALPLAFTFLFGVINLLYTTFQRLQGNMGTDYISALSEMVAGAAWVALWPALARMSDPRGNGPLVPRRTYVYILLASALVSGVISLAIGLYYALTAAIGTPADPIGNGTSEAFATTIVAAATGGYYLFVLLRDQRILRARQPVPPATAPEIPNAGPTLEGVLQSVAEGQLAVAQAATILREYFGAR